MLLDADERPQGGREIGAGSVMVLNNISFLNRVHFPREWPSPSRPPRGVMVLSTMHVDATWQIA
jgi:hypothetical protein